MKMGKNNKRLGRPKTSEEDRIQYRISAKFSAKEIKFIKENAENAGISLYEYIRQALLHAEVHPRILPEEMTAYKELYAEVRHIGININSIARKANIGLNRDYDADISNALFSLEEVITTFKKKLI